MYLIIQVKLPNYVHHIERLIHAHGEVYLIRHDAINFVRELWNTRGFFPEAPITHPVFTINHKKYNIVRTPPK